MAHPVAGEALLAIERAVIGKDQQVGRTAVADGGGEGPRPFRETDIGWMTNLHGAVANDLALDGGDIGGTLDATGVAGRKRSRSKYGAKRPKAA